jgi:hypothetical protein
MGAICRIYERSGRGLKKVAEIRDGKVTGKKAVSIRKLLKQYGFPNAPLEDVIDQLLLTGPAIGVALVGPMDQDPKKP